MAIFSAVPSIISNVVSKVNNLSPTEKAAVHQKMVSQGDDSVQGHPTTVFSQIL